MLDTKRDIPGKHWGDYQFTGHDYDSLSADPTVDVMVLPALPGVIKVADMGGYAGLSADSRTMFAQLMAKTILVPTTKSDPIQGNAVPSTTGQGSTWFTDAISGGYAVLFNIAEAKSQRAVVMMTRGPDVAALAAASGKWAVAAAPDGMVQAGMTKAVVNATPIATRVLAPTPSDQAAKLALYAQQDQQKQQAIEMNTVSDAVSQPIPKSNLITGIVAKTAVKPAASTSELFLPVASSTTTQKIVSSVPIIENPYVTPPTPVYPPAQDPTVAPYSDMSTMPYAPTDLTAKDALALQQQQALLKMNDLTGGGGGGGTITTTGDDGTLPPVVAPSKTIYYVAGGLAVAGVGYYLYTQSQKKHRKNCSSRRRQRRR